ncbi:tetratricopeptide repeat-containing sensor histidine kinase [Sediminibacterium sp.]|uniref:tetratricopeptide repeat-containing sensor histidine kinase n=1 Tax=Sediminibacterium sp. TaxID=1917865 RepID=UPI003F715A72
MKYILFVIILSLIHALPISAQYQREIDSLKSIIPVNIKDTNQLNALAQLAFYYSFTDSTNAFKYANTVINYSNQFQFRPGIAAALRTKGNYFIIKRTAQKAIPFLNQEATIWQQLKRPKEMAANYTMQGQAFSLLGNFEESAANFDKAESIYKKLNDQKALSVLYHNAGAMFTEKTEPKLALQYLIKSLEIQELLNDTKTIGATQNNIGRLFYQTKNYPKAIEYFKKSIKANVISKDWRNLGIAHVNLANVYVDLNDYPSAINELNESLDFFNRVDFKRGMQVVYNNMGAMNIRQKNYASAVPLLKKALELANQNQSKAGVALIEQNIGLSLAGLNENVEALKWYEKAEQTAIESKADDYSFGEIYNHRSALDSSMGNFHSALIYRSKYMRINEKFMGEKVIKDVNELQTKYETQKKEYTISLLNKSDSIKSLEIANQQLAINQSLFKISEQKLKLADAELQIISDSLLLYEQNKQLLQAKLDSSNREDRIRRLAEQNRIKALEVSKKNNQIVIVLISICFLALAIYFIYKRNKAIQDKLYQQQLLEQQKNAAIEVINAEEKERKRIATDLHDGIGQLMSAAYMNLQALKSELGKNNLFESSLLDKSLTLVNESCKEVRQVSHNMMPNALLLKGLVNAVQEFIGQINQHSLKINLATEGLKDGIPTHIEAVLYRVIQESVQNVIKHANASVLDISISKSTDGIDVMIEDNGIGFNINELTPSNGIGLSNIKSRIQYLEGTVEWNTSKNNGTLVAIFIPLTFASTINRND